VSDFDEPHRVWLTKWRQQRSRARCKIKDEALIVDLSDDLAAVK